MPASNPWLRKQQLHSPPTINNYNVYPLEAPGMPLPGVDFVRHAISLGDQDVTYDGKKVKDKKLASYGKWLEYLYSRATYEPNTTLPVLFKTAEYNVRLIPGHIWTSGVFGPAKSKVMVIGKIPGKEERVQGRNLVGPSGQELIQCLEEMGEYSWPTWYITNLVKFPHPEPFASGAMPADWIKDCLLILHQELRIVKPDYILCLGTDALKAIIGKPVSISNATGQVYKFSIPLHRRADEEPRMHEIQVMACIHPAAVLRAPDTHPQLVAGLRSFCDLINGRDVAAEETDLEHYFIDNSQDLAKLINEIKKDKNNASIAWDSEWHGEYPEEDGSYLRTIQFSWQPKKACCVILRHAGGAEAFRPGIREAIRLLNGLGKKTKDWPARAIGHFFRADLPWLIHAGLDLRAEYDAPPDTPTVLGWERTYDEGGFDTGLSAHAHTEAGASYKLEVLANQRLGIHRYDRKLIEWKTKYCKENGLKAEDLDGYGAVPGEILYPYSAMDADSTRRLFDLYNKRGGLLDKDLYGNCCREAFWIGQRASLAVLEMEMTGITLDKKRAEEMSRTYRDARSTLIQKLREDINWENFNPNSTSQCRELLFGEGFSGVIDKETGKNKRVSPDDAILCDLMPVKTTGKRPMQWTDVIGRGEEHKHQPCADKEVLGILSADSGIAGLLRNIRFVDQLLKTSLRPPKKGADDQELKDDDGDYIYDRGLISYMCNDRRIRSHFFQTKETGRFSSARPNLQSLSARREDDYRKILGDKYTAPLRSIFMASPGHVLIEADFQGAELYIAALMCGSKNMIDHCERGNLDKNDPRYYDIHSNTAVAAFKLNCAPTKDGLKSIGKEALRIAAKTVAFGLMYGRGAAAIARAVKEEKVEITVAQAQALIDAFYAKYPELRDYMEQCKARVKDPGFICNCFGRFRRFRWSGDRSVIGEMERQAMNFIEQSDVADACSRALDHLYHLRHTFNVSYKIVLQIHDAVILEVPIKDIEKVYDEVLPTCMTKLVDVWPSDLNGMPYRGAKPANLGVDRKVQLRWGESIKKEEAIKLGIPLRFAKGG